MERSSIRRHDTRYTPSLRSGVTFGLKIPVEINPSLQTVVAHVYSEVLCPENPRSPRFSILLLMAPLGSGAAISLLPSIAKDSGVDKVSVTRFR